MIFKKEKILLEYTLEKCSNCKKESKREYQDNDLLFSKSGICSSCDGELFVERIFSEDVS
jgi:hypothetical protein